MGRAYSTTQPLDLLYFGHEIWSSPNPVVRAASWVCPASKWLRAGKRSLLFGRYFKFPPSGTLSELTPFELQSRLGDKPVKFQVVCPRSGTAVLKGPRRYSLFLHSSPQAGAVASASGERGMVDSYYCCCGGMSMAIFVALPKR